MRTTIRDVAMAAGCSITAVSLVLNGKTRNISAQTEVRILDAAKQLNYHPNKLASHLVTKKSNIIGLILPDNCNLFFGMVLKAAEHEADQAGYRVICGNSNNSINKDCAYINTFIDYCVDGILIIKSDSPKQEENEQLAELIRTLPSPVVAIDRQIDGLDVPTYTVNNMYGGYTATKHLLEMGHRRIGYYTYPLRVYTAAQRLKGYKMALAEYGVPYDPELVCQLSNGFSGNHRAVGDFRRKGVTAVFAHNDTLAYELYKFAQMEGVRVPSDMSIVGFDDLDFSTIITPGLTTIRQPVDEMTHGAFRRLVAMIEAGGKDPMRDSNSIYEPKLICRDSVCRL